MSNRNQKAESEFVDKLKNLIKEFRASSNDGKIQQDNSDFLLFYSFGNQQPSSQQETQAQKNYQLNFNQNQDQPSQKQQDTLQKIIPFNFQNLNLDQNNMNLSNLLSLDLNQLNLLIQGDKNQKNSNNQTQKEFGNKDDMSFKLSLETFKAFNQYRKENNLSEIAWDNDIYKLCKQHTEYQLQQDKISHDDFDSRLSEFQAANENVAMFTSWNQTPTKTVADKFMNQWIRSPGHKKNLVATNIDRGAIFVEWDEDPVYKNKYFATQINVKKFNYQLN